MMILGSDMDTFVLKVLYFNKYLQQQIYVVGTKFCRYSAVGLVKEEFLSNFPGFVFLNDLKATVKNKSFSFLFLIFVYSSEASVAFLYPLKAI